MFKTNTALNVPCNGFRLVVWTSKCLSKNILMSIITSIRFVTRALTQSKISNSYYSSWKEEEADDDDGGDDDG